MGRAHSGESPQHQAEAPCAPAAEKHPRPLLDARPACLTPAMPLRLRPTPGVVPVQGLCLRSPLQGARMPSGLRPGPLPPPLPPAPCLSPHLRGGRTHLAATPRCLCVVGAETGTGRHAGLCKVPCPASPGHGNRSGPGAVLTRPMSPQVRGLRVRGTGPLRPPVLAPGPSSCCTRRPAALAGPVLGRCSEGRA